MSIAGYGRAILSRTLSQSATRQTAATLAHFASRSTSKSVDFVSNTTQLNSPTDRSIFEDESEDYARIHPTPQMLSTMSRIEAGLPLHLPEPVVSDMSIFEDITSSTSRSDYAAVRVDLRQPPSSASQALEHLILGKQFEEAWALCQEMLNSDIEIPRSNLYGFGAMDALSSNELSEEEKLSRLSQWLSMIPSARENCGRGDQRIRVMKRRVFQVLQPTMTLAIRFSLILASKGYIELICPEAVMFVTRFASPPLGLRFVKSLLDHDLSYIADVDSQGEEGLQETRDEIRLRRLQELAHRVPRPAIETLARSGQFHAAMSLLPTTKDPYRLATGAYGLLLSRLRHAPQGYPDYIEQVEKLSLDPLYSIEIPWSPFDAQPDECNSFLRHLQPLEEEVHPGSPFYIGETLAAQLQSILNDVRLTKLSVSELVTFFSNYLESGRTTAIYRLRKLVLGVNWPMGSVFLYAEMSYYLKNKLYLLVLQTYANYFYFSGVPEKEVVAAIYRLDETNRGHPAYSVKRTDSVRKWIPTESHTDLAWHALARAVHSGDDIENLYHRFLEYQFRIRTRDDNTPEDTTYLRFPPSVKKPIGTSVFTVFISRLLDPQQASRASEFLRDMNELGINPTIHHYTLLATFYVHAGDIQRALSVVNFMEQAHPVESPSPMQLCLETVHRQRPEPGIPTPDFIFYTSLISALSELEYLEDAKVVRQLFFNRFTYTEGLHHPLDYALDLLQQREAYQKRVNATPMIVESVKNSAASRATMKPLRRGRACLNCRFLKIKCDGAKPLCGPCQKHPKDDDCEYADGPGKSRTKVLEDTVSRLEARLRDLEHPEESTPSVALHDPYSLYPGSLLQQKPLSTPEARSVDSSSPFSLASSSSSLPPTLPWRTSGILESSSDSAGPRGPLSSSHGQDASSSLLGAEEPGLMTIKSLLDKFLPYCQEFGFFFEPSRFREAALLPLPFGHSSRPSPALLSAVYLWGVHLSRSEELLQHEQSFLFRALQHVVTDTFRNHPDVILHTMQAEVLLSYYLLRTGRFIEAKCHTGTAVSLALGAGLHKIRSAYPTVVPTLGLSSDAPVLLPAPIDGIAEVERINGFWAVVVLHKCIMIALNPPMSVSGTLEAPNIQVDTPWPPNHSRELNAGNISANNTIGNFLCNTESQAHSIAICKVKAAILFHRSAQLAGQLTPDMQPHEIQSHLGEFQSLHQLIEKLRLQLAPILIQNINHPSTRNILFTYVLVDGASIKIHDYFSREPSSQQHCLAAARRIVAYGGFGILKAGTVNPFVGTLLVLACNVIINEIHRVRSSATAEEGEDELMEILRSGIAALNARSDESALTRYQLAQVQEAFSAI
ncbi:hypothetical protein C0992_008602 [Termitomyces sp. T32_za158]|nr:hypothetical protein C0992_008602 [Termitomyces sp. T32_za158]